MNIEDLKKDWNKLSEFHQDNQLSEAEIKKFISKRNKITWLKALIPESIFILINLYLVFFLLVFNNMYDMLSLRILAFFCIVILMSQCIVIISTISIFNKQTKLLESFQNTILNLKQECETLNKRYYLIIIFSAIILICCIILLPKVYNETLSTTQLIWSNIVGLSILAFVKFIIYKFYKKLIVKNNAIKKILTKTT